MCCKCGVESCRSAKETVSCEKIIKDSTFLLVKNDQICKNGSANTSN